MDIFEDIIYFSGYTDGDGSFGITYSSNKFHVSFCITAANFKIVSDLINKFEGTVSYSKQIINQKPLYRFSKYGKNSYEFAKKIYPYLIQRKEECRLFISYFDPISKNKRLEIVKKLREQHKELNFVNIDDIEKLKVIQRINPTKEDFIYMAGFIDAECNFTITKHKPTNRPNFVYKIVLQFNDTKKPMFFWIKSRFGGFCCYFRRTKGKKDQITYRLTGKSLYPFLKQVVPYLRFKKPVCEKLIEFYETTLTNGGARHTEIFRNTYSSVIEKRESIIQQVHILNKKGL